MRWHSHRGLNFRIRRPIHVPAASHRRSERRDLQRFHDRDDLHAALHDPSSYFRAARTAPRSRGHAFLLGLALPMPFAPNAANLLCSTAPDRAKFVAELMAPTLVSRALVEQMLTPT